MPRTNLCGNRKKNMIKDLPAFIKGKLFANDMTYDDLAEPLNITKQALSYRLIHEKKEAKDLFTYGDLLVLFKETNATDEEILRVMKL